MTDKDLRRIIWHNERSKLALEIASPIWPQHDRRPK
jgi:hypothetical protein